MPYQTLEQLKAENAESEQEATQVTPDSEEQSEVEAVEQSDSDVVEAGEPEQQAQEDESTEAWMQTDEQASSSEGAKFTDHDVAAAKRNLRAKLEKKHGGEVDELRSEIESLKSQLKAPASQSAKPLGGPPRAEDYDFDDQKLEKARADYYSNLALTQLRQENESTAQAKANEMAQKKLNDAVDSHYERAEKLVRESGISAENYKEAGTNLAHAIEVVMPGKGEAVTNGLIANMGEGSEKVAYYLGRNPSALRELQNMLSEDPTGIKASMHLGTLKAKFLAKPQIKSNAKPPAASVEGDGGSVNTKDYKKLWQKASKANEVQKAFDIRREARKQGVDTRTW